MKSIESITVGPSRAESKQSAKVESIDRVGQKWPWIDRLARLDRFRGLGRRHPLFGHRYSDTRHSDISLFGEGWEEYKRADQHQNLTICSWAHVEPSQKISCKWCKSVH